MIRPNLGAHVSTAGGLHKAIENATRIGAETIQFFGASPRAWSARVPTREDVALFKGAMAPSDVKSAYLHASYLVNLGTPDPELLTKSIANLSAHLVIAEQLGARGLIFHAGSAKGNSGQALQQTIKSLATILETIPGSSKLIIENAAGGGEKIGSKPEDIGEIISALRSPRVATCFDTAHAFEAGLVEHYDRAGIEKLIARLDEAIGLDRLVALHVNDSKTKFDSRHDAHENLGEGFIGLEAFRALAKTKELQKADWILEVPGFDDLGPDKKNVDILKSCFK